MLRNKPVFLINRTGTMKQEDKLGISPEWDILKDSMEATRVATSGNNVYEVFEDQ